MKLILEKYEKVVGRFESIEEEFDINIDRQAETLVAELYSKNNRSDVVAQFSASMYEPEELYDIDFSQEFSYEEFKEFFPKDTTIVYLNTLEVPDPNKGKGYGAYLFSSMIDYFDIAGFEQLYGNARPYGNKTTRMSRDILVKFYKGFDFEIFLETENNTLIRRIK